MLMAWIGDGRSKPSASMAASNGAGRPSSEKGGVSMKSMCENPAETVYPAAGNKAIAVSRRKTSNFPADGWHRCMQAMQ
jgi:hypothetical protein